jgi:hypothetical protein
MSTSNGAVGNSGTSSTCNFLSLSFTLRVSAIFLAAFCCVVMCVAQHYIVRISTCSIHLPGMPMSYHAAPHCTCTHSAYAVTRACQVCAYIRMCVQCAHCSVYMHGNTTAYCKVHKEHFILLKVNVNRLLYTKNHMHLCIGLPLQRSWLLILCLYHLACVHLPLHVCKPCVVYMCV